MALKFCSLASGSSGNCYLIKSENTTVLIDVGISGKYIIERLRDKNIKMGEIDGILVTHEHIDHVRSIRMIGKKAERAIVYGSKGTLTKLIDKMPLERYQAINELYKPFKIGDINVTPFHLSHDAIDPTGYSLENNGRKVTIVTDTGCITQEIYRNMRDSDLLILEANHEVNILRMGPYPYSLQQRILGKEGHLSNETAAKCIVKLAKDGGKNLNIVLAHLSNENNTPEQAYLTIRNILFEDDLYIDKDVQLNIVKRDEASMYMEV